MRDTVMGLLCMMLGVAALSLEINRLVHCSTRAKAKIIEVKRQTDSKGFTRYNPVFEFHVDGRTIRGNGGMIGSLSENRYEVGEYRTIFYDKGNPESFRLRGNYILIIVGAIFLLGGIFLYRR